MNKKLFMLKKIIKDIKAPKNRYSLPKKLHSEILGEYYFLFEEKRIAGGKDQALISKFDENGIPVNKTYIDVKDKDYVYFPISIGQMGLSIFHTYLKTRSEQDKKRFLKFADWFLQNGEETEELGCRWMTDVSLPQYNNSGPWQSAFSQSRGISILLRAYQVTGEQKYFQCAEKALIPFTKSIKEGGVTAFTKWGPFYEEYTSDVPTLVLNGMVFALCGVYDFVRISPENDLARRIFDEGIETLKNILPEYDLGYWSRYNICEADWYPKIDPATILYHRLHITQLELLIQLSKEKIFKDFKRKFIKQDNIFNAIRMYLTKAKALKKIGRL